MATNVVNLNEVLFKEIKDFIKIKYFLRKLPIDIVKMIWIEYIKPELISNKLNLILNSSSSINFDYFPLCNYLPVVLNNKYVTEYLINNNQIFNQIYEEHIIKRNKLFEQFPDILSSMALSWLMYLYH